MTLTLSASSDDHPARTTAAVTITNEGFVGTQWADLTITVTMTDEDGETSVMDDTVTIYVPDLIAVCRALEYEINRDAK